MQHDFADVGGPGQVGVPAPQPLAVSGVDAAGRGGAACKGGGIAGACRAGSVGACQRDAQMGRGTLTALRQIFRALPPRFTVLGTLLWGGVGRRVVAATVMFAAGSKSRVFETAVRGWDAGLLAQQINHSGCCCLQLPADVLLQLGAAGGG
jgi:hypothetical protein